MISIAPRQAPPGQPGLMLPERAEILVYSTAETLEEGARKLPFVRALRQAFPTAAVTWLAGQGQSSFRHALNPLAAPLLDTIIDDAGLGRRLHELWTRPLNGHCFDLVIDTQERLMTALILKRIRSRYFLSSAGRYRLSDRRPIDPCPQPAPLIAALLELVALAQGARVAQAPPLRLDPLIEQLAARLLPQTSCFLLAPSAASLGAGWPLQHYVTTARALALSGRVPVLLLDEPHAQRHDDLAAAIPTALFPLQRIAAELRKTRPDLVLALARRCWAAVTEDGAPAHLIAAAGTPLTVLYGPDDSLIQAPVACRFIPLRAQRPNIATIQPSAVLRALEMLVQVT